MCNVLSKILWEGRNKSPEHYYGANTAIQIFLPSDFGDDKVIQFCAKLETPIHYQINP